MTKPTDSIVATLEAAAKLLPYPGYVNGDTYSEWYIPATPALLRALAELARTQGSTDLADRLDRFSHPLCMEPLDAVLPTQDMPRKWCGNPVTAGDEPCAEHTPERAADLGRCTWTAAETARICRSAPAPGDDRCEVHAAYCRAVKGNGAVCNRRHCSVPKHRTYVPAGQ